MLSGQTVSSKLTRDETERFLDWALTTDPDLIEGYQRDYGTSVPAGILRDLIKDTGGWALCNEVAGDLATFAERLDRFGSVGVMAIGLPHPRYPGGGEVDKGHTICVIDGLVHDFTAGQFGDYPVPYCWPWEE
tara:strand:- start:2606 stop:3004 length:399 start_codon:yes stop_codon:yes gene_type:complete